MPSGSCAWPFGEGLVGLSAERGEPIAIERARQHPRFRYFPETGEERFESLMAAPIVLRNISIGVLVVQTEKPRGFTTEEVELLQTCAQLIAPVVMNAQLLALVTWRKSSGPRCWTRWPPRAFRCRWVGRRGRLRNLEVRGIPTARGVAIGPLYRLEDPLDLENLDYDAECRSGGRSAASCSRRSREARRELHSVRDEVGERFGPEFAAVFNTHIQILEDKGFVAALEQAVRETADALRALREVLAAYQKTFQSIEDPYFRERGDDIQDVGLPRDGEAARACGITTSRSPRGRSWSPT